MLNGLHFPNDACDGDLLPLGVVVEATLMANPPLINRSTWPVLVHSRYLGAEHCLAMCR
jgi:hypothetical protein